MTGKNIINVIHVDDDINERERMKKLLLQFEGINQVGEFSNATDALAFLQKNDVHLAFLDIEMKGKDGFWLAEKMRAHTTKIIFVTSHADFALKAFEACAINYLLKPVSKKTLGDAVERFRNSLPTEQVNNQNTDTGEFARIQEFVDNYLDNKAIPKRIFISNLQRITVLNITEIAYFSAQGTYTEIVTIDGNRLVASKNLKFYADILERHPDFVRIHRSSLVNKFYLSAIRRDGNLNFVVMKDNTELEISSARKEEIISQLLS